MIKRQKESKKSTSKDRRFKVSPLISVIAMIEVVVLVIVSTYAWFILRSSKKIGTGNISVDADSGLDIDFQYSNVDDYINIWNYVSPDFKFEPATSLDGRNIYFPTTGTFNATDTRSMVFRDGTINDINSKYLSIDFELTNTSGSDQYVYLNNTSYFHVLNKDGDSEESRALRLAFYQNDGNSGNVGSSLIRNSSNTASDGGDAAAETSQNAYTFYFDNTYTKWPAVYAHVYHLNATGDGDGKNYDVPVTDWPGLSMSRVNGSVYSVTIDNPNMYYNRVIFSNNGSSKSGTFTLPTVSDSAWHYYGKASSAASISDLGVYTEDTIYFIKPNTWTAAENDEDGIADVYCHAWTKSGSDTNAYTTYPGDKLKYMGSGIYAYSYNSANTGGFLFNNGSQGNTNQTENIVLDENTNDSIYYCDGSTGANGRYVASRYVQKKYSELTYKTVYFYNTHGWSKPYANVRMSASSNDISSVDIALVSLSANMYYCTVPDIYSKAYFKAKDNASDSYRTKTVDVEHQYVYRAVDNTTPEAGHNYRDVNTFIYSDYIMEGGYPVISPGVSVGFQRAYSPVVAINNETGMATEIVPAYSNSIDNYILGSNIPLFELKAGHMASLSMIMWLEGTDPAAQDSDGYVNPYPANQIDFELQFSTLYYTQEEGQQPVQHIVNPGDSAAYTYNFYDRTREIWTSDRQKTESGVTVAPVMQLYDNTIKRGYLMHENGRNSYGGVKKISCWTVNAPQSVAKHDIIFRRVNPYNEDEVWNYWHAGPAGDENGLYTIAFENDTVSFTAFSDGSPRSADLETAYKAKNPGKTDAQVTAYLTDADVPEYSCGGLWGNHTVRELSVLDGTKGQYLKDNKGIVSIQYSYTYSNGTSNRTVRIEYKSSGPDYNALYHFVVPSLFYEKTGGTANITDVKFKRYYNFKRDFAINSDRNDEILYDRTWGGSGNSGMIPTGMYFAIAQTANTDRSLSFNTYWGSDMLYIQTSNSTCREVFTDNSSNSGRAMRIEFNNGSNTDDSKKFWTTLFENDQFKANYSGWNNGKGYPVVIPNNREYNKYRIHMAFFADSLSSRIFTSYADLFAATISGTAADATTLTITNAAFGNGNSYNICQVKSFKSFQIYFETDMYQIKNGAHNAYLWGPGGTTGTYPGYSMTYNVNPYSNNQDVVRYSIDVNPNDYSKCQFSYKWNYNNQGDTDYKIGGEQTITPYDANKLYKYYKSNNDWVLTSDSPPSSNSKEILQFDAVSADSTDWPHYSAQGS